MRTSARFEVSGPILSTCPWTPAQQGGQWVAEGRSVGNDCDRGKDYLGRVRFEASPWSTQGVSTHLVHTETPPLPHGNGKRDGANGGGGVVEGGSWGWSGDLGGGVCGVVGGWVGGDVFAVGLSHSE